MMIRIVKLGFAPEKVDTFRELFDQKWSLIRHFPGCLHLELWQEPEKGNVFFTYSHWESPEALENYRSSTVFREIWATIKVMFNTKPEAWTVQNQILPAPETLEVPVSNSRDKAFQLQDTTPSPLLSAKS